jgi:hypothetical protein
MDTTGLTGIICTGTGIITGMDTTGVGTGIITTMDITGVGIGIIATMDTIGAGIVITGMLTTTATVDLRFPAEARPCALATEPCPPVGQAGTSGSSDRGISGSRRWFDRARP